MNQPAVYPDPETLTEWRRDFHRHPEIAFEETRTSQRIVKILREHGLDPVTGLGGGTVDQQRAVSPYVVQIVVPVESDAERVEAAGVVILIDHLGVEHFRVVRVDLKDATLGSVGSPDDNAVAIVVGQAHADFRRPRFTICGAHLPRRLAVVMLNPAVVLRRIDGQNSVVQIGRASCRERV